MPAKYNTKYNTNRETPSVYADYKLSLTGSSPVTCTNKEIGLKRLKPRNLGIKPFFLFFDNRYHGIKAAKIHAKTAQKAQNTTRNTTRKTQDFPGFRAAFSIRHNTCGKQKKPRISPEKPGPQSSKIFADLLLLCSPHDTLYLKIENHFDNSAYTTRNGGI